MDIVSSPVAFRLPSRYLSAARCFDQVAGRMDRAIPLIFIAQSVFLARFFWRIGFWRSTRPVELGGSRHLQDYLQRCSVKTRRRGYLVDERSET